MNTFAAYQPASGCTKYGPAGAQALLTYTEDVFTELHRSMGICNCRPVNGGGSWSHHAECRALDSGFTIVTGQPWGYWFALILAEHGARVGLDHIITNAEPWASGRGKPLIFSARSPSGRTYTGAHPHKDHNHNGLTRNAGRNLTYATLVAVYGTPAQVAARLKLTITGGEQMLDRNSPRKSPAVAMYQRDLIELGYDLGDWDSIQPGLYPRGADGGFGGDVERGTKEFQTDMKLAVTGKADALTVALAANLARFNQIRKVSAPAAPDLSGFVKKADLTAHAANPDAHHA